MPTSNVIGWATGHSFNWSRGASDILREQAMEGMGDVIGWATGHGFDWSRGASDILREQALEEVQKIAGSEILAY